MKKLWTFKGGLKLPGFKKISNPASVNKIPIPDNIILPLRQHIGEPAEPIVDVGDQVYKGQPVAISKSLISASVHASTSGIVTDIGKYTIPHQSGVSEMCIVIKTDQKDQWHPNIESNLDPDNLDTEELCARIREAGIVGLGGAVFPSAVKLKATRQIDTLIINGAECEPYITCDDALMQNRADDVVQGILLLRRLLNPAECIIAIEDNKPQAIDALQVSIKKFKEKGIGSVAAIDVIPIPTIFPTGGEKQLIKVLTGKEVPRNGLPYEVGVICLNVGTSAAIRNAIYEGIPLVSRYVTVTGVMVQRPANFEVLIGTPVQDVIKAAGGEKSDRYEIIMGGPMMGQLLPHQQIPVVKATNCILVQDIKSENEANVMPCIRCGSCASACPMSLLPQQLYWYAKEKSFQKLQHYNLSDCIECGCCAVVCPSRIPLVQYFRFAKSEQREHEFKTKLSEQSRIRAQMRDFRLERIKREQQERKARRKAERLKKKAASDKASKPLADKELSAG